mgnify:CR=1 FL=1
MRMSPVRVILHAGFLASAGGGEHSTGRGGGARSRFGSWGLPRAGRKAR